MNSLLAKFASEVLVRVSKSVVNSASPTMHSPEIPEELKK
jgi:cyclic lactone autoinducer peptide